MQKLLCGILLLCALGLRAETSPTYAALGEMILTNLPSAPFPHPLRTNGHTYKDKKFPADKHYTNNTVAIFVPKGFQENAQTDFIVHFHGWYGDVATVLSKFQLIHQLAESGRNVILVVPQGPYGSPDSFGGKLEDKEGFKRFMEEVQGALRAQGHLQKSELGKIILSGHSGGYQVISSIVAQGGLTEHIQEVWLFDALYARTEKFTAWFEQGQGRLLNIYTDRGGTDKETLAMQAAMTAKRTPLLAAEEVRVNLEQLRTNRLVFLHTPLSHNGVLAEHRTFRDFLKTSFLGAVNKPLSLVSPARQDPPGQRLALWSGNLFVPDHFKGATNTPADLVVFLHGASWCAEMAFAEAHKNAVLLSVTSTNWDTRFRTPTDWTNLLADVSTALQKEKVASGVGRVTVASFSGGYAGVRHLLRMPEVAAGLQNVVLADSLYGARDAKDTNRLDFSALQPFLDFARRAADGKAGFYFSQLYPPEAQYRNNTTTVAAATLIEKLGLEKVPEYTRVRRGNVILYRAEQGGVHLYGYAGMTTQDHFEHFYGLAELLEKTPLEAAK